MTPSDVRPRLRLGPRLVDSRRFAWLKASAARMSQGCLIANWAPAAGASVSRLGVITGRRLGSAAERSRARRLLREAYRLHRPALLSPVDLVLIARSSIRGLRLCDVERDLLRVLQKARLAARVES